MSKMNDLSSSSKINEWNFAFHLRMGQFQVVQIIYRLRA